ncbi:uncharacterized protein LOC130535469 isoform X2 [Takifugu flavidus]|uniref:uncharacterized protein LOC130535469 isoform X2 n=1 Tax=Takifugu flavidus TaxID=433684 RepID=UPI002544893A|nr:uncharacterized protein LOC130535469 isoform X2 [Takifugu flavidus]
MIRYCSTFTAPNTNITNMIKHYVQLSDSVICKLPTMKLNVNGKTLKFVVDTGATYSVIRKHDLPHTDMSSRSLHSMGASGVSTRETFSLPLNCRLGDHGFKHSFLMSSSCPLNLMGRDLILGLGVNLVSTPEGLELRRPDAQSITMLAKPVTQDTLWIYVWSINEQSAQQMLLSAKEKLIPTAHMQQVDAVHCTARVTEHRDNAYEEQFYAQASVDLMTAKMYWNSTRCPVSVSLCKPECDLFDVLSSVPHVSLARSHKDEWKHIGQWTRLCEEATDWEQTLDPKDGSALLQYVDDLLLCAPTRTPCVQDTVTLLTHLVKEGHKVSRTKMQYAQQIVTFLGHKISRDQRTLHTLPQPDHLSM